MNVTIFMNKARGQRFSARKQTLNYAHVTQVSLIDTKNQINLVAVIQLTSEN